MNVIVPGPLLCDRNLTDAAKLLWVVNTLCSQSHPGAITARVLQERSGFTRHTILRGLRQLTATGWLGGESENKTACHVAIPEDLIQEHRVGTPAKLIYGAIQLTPGFRNGKGHFTYAQVAGLTGMSHNTVKQAARSLHQTGWLSATHEHKHSPIRFVLQNPVEAGRQQEAEAAGERLVEAKFTGEAIMREYLNLLVTGREYIDNANPSYLVNPLSGQLLEFDRYYPPDVAFEYQGTQHFTTTDLYPKESKLRKQMARDLIKTAICLKAGVTLVAIHESDLSLTAMLEKVSGVLPLRNLKEHDPLVEYLDRISKRYQIGAERQRRRKRSS